MSRTAQWGRTEMPDNLAFMSYVRADDDQDEILGEDELESSRLSRLRETLSAEVERASGTPFEIFQDSVDIRWGSDWRARTTASHEPSDASPPSWVPG